MAVWPCRPWFPVGGCKEDHRPQPNTPVPFAALDFSNDPDARAVMGIPGTPDDDEAIVMAPAKVPRQSLPPPVQAAVASEAGQPSDFGCGHG